MIREFVPRMLRMGAERIFISFLLLFILALLITGLVWYWSLRMEHTGSRMPGTVFHKDTLLEIIWAQEERAKEIQKVSLKEYRDIFFPEK